MLLVESGGGSSTSEDTLDVGGDGSLGVEEPEITEDVSSNLPANFTSLTTS